MKVLAFSSFILLCLMSGAEAQGRPRPGGASCTAENTCPMQAPYRNVTITSDENFRYVTTFQCPPYDNPMWTNPNSACISEVTYKFPLRPTRPTTIDGIPVGKALERHNNILYLKEDPRPILGTLGVLLNGVNIFGVGSPCGFGSPCPNDGGPSMYVDAVESEGHTTDQCAGHSSPNGAYHVHSNLGFNTSDPSGRQICQLPIDTPGEHSQLLGWMFDGYGIYGQLSENGEVPTNLDDCGGHTHEIDGVSTYHYHFPYPSQFPWVIGCFKGCPEVSNNQMELGSMTQYGCGGSTNTTGGDGGGAEAIASVSIKIIGALIVLSYFVCC